MRTHLAWHANLVICNQEDHVTYSTNLVLEANDMLVLSRREGERIQIDGSATIVVTRIANNRVCLGIEADPSVRILRGELTDSTPPSAADMEAKPVLQQMASV